MKTKTVRLRNLPFSPGRVIKDMPIRNKLIAAFLILFFIPAIGIGYLSFDKSKTLLEKKTDEYNRDVLSGISKSLEIYLQQIETFSQALMFDQELCNGLEKSNRGISDEYAAILNTKNIERRLSSFLNSRSDVESLGIIDASDNFFSASFTLEPFSIHSTQKKVMDSAKGSFVLLDAEPRRKVIPAGRIITDLKTQKKIGYLLINIKEENICNTYNEAILSHQGTFFIINQNGKVVSSNDKGILNNQLDAPYVDKVLGGGQSGFFKQLIDNKNDYVSFYLIGKTNWKIVSIIPSIEFEKEIYSLRNSIFLIAILCWVLAVVVSIFLSKSISEPIRRLSRMMKEFGSGNFNVSSNYESRDEVGLLSNRFNKMVEQIQKLIKEVYHEQLLKQKTELMLLRMQINPHFLYNTLESINWLSRIKGIPEIGKMVKALGDLMRISISGEEFITLEEEIKNINNYFYIQKFRYGEKIEMNVTIQEQVLGVKVPKLLLQPVVENSIVHGIERKEGKGTINIDGFEKNGCLLMMVTDDGVGIADDRLPTIFDGTEKQDSTHTKIGIRNIDRRIKLYFGEEFGLKIQSMENSYTRVVITLPVQ